MAELNVNVIARWVDRMTGGAKASIKAMAGLGVAQAAVTKAHANATRATTFAMKASDALTKSTGAQTLAALGALRIAQDQALAIDAVSRATSDATQRMSNFERVQRRGAAATRMLGGEMDKLDKQLGRLAMASIATEGLHRAGHAIANPLERAIDDASKFSGGMTGIGITAELSNAQLAPIRNAIMSAATRMALSPDAVQETFAFTRRSGVFRTVPQIVAAGNEATRFQKLAERMGSPIAGEDVAGGAASAVREYGFSANPQGIRRFFAMIDAAEKTGGGMKISDLLEYARSSGGQMKSLKFGNAAGLSDVLAGLQLSNYLAHTGGQAGINFQDLLTQSAQRFTLRRYRQHGVNLEKAIKLGEAKGISPIETIGAITKKITGGDRFRIGELMHNAQGTQAMLALIQNLDKFRAYSAQIRSAATVGQYNADVSRVLNDQRTAVERLAVAQERLGIATGTILLPAMTKLAGFAERIATAFSKMEEKGNPLGKILVYAASGFALAATGAAALGQAIVGIVAPIWIMKSMFKTFPLGLIAARGAMVRLAAASWGLVASLLANPFVWAVAGLAALAVGGYELVKHWKPVMAWLDGFWKGIVKGVGNAFEAVKHFFTWSPPKWLGTVASIAAMVTPGGAVLAAPIGAAVQAAATPKPPAHTVKVEQHFHINGAEHIDAKALAREMKRMSAEGLNRALHDGGSE